MLGSSYQLSRRGSWGGDDWFRFRWVWFSSLLWWRFPRVLPPRFFLSSYCRNHHHQPQPTTTNHNQPQPPDLTTSTHTNYHHARSSRVFIVFFSSRSSPSSSLGI
ncbi:hypothetical protein PAPYR_8287 [Paratrimastix pyriformis]|uniref:Uncharacterized protein n=1 Tax=Paratrimastix pyriformis TaxID=342808 RepID=A0ABQ8UAX8_9EUKA|nr:hypothetical protein PAPYR_8287 [Paratrimastix pyriformis]